ncbi:hypothetical protein [Trueperella pyogenes]|uniref:hypothetical protein n=1 Tax=Trueperella pyogenes TaxID=1661 RepID=UPI003DA7DEDB
MRFPHDQRDPVVGDEHAERQMVMDACDFAMGNRFFDDAHEFVRDQLGALIDRLHLNLTFFQGFRGGSDVV